MSVNYSDFYNAQDARLIAIGQRSGGNDILTEVNILQIAVDQAAAAGNLTVNVLSTTTLTFNGVTLTGSPMTLDTDDVFFKAWSDPATYQTSPYMVAREKMDTVVGYFSRLGFSIKRFRDGVSNKFYWAISY